MFAVLLACCVIQGEGRWNPFGFDYSPEMYERRQLQELKNGRLAMVR